MVMLTRHKYMAEAMLSWSWGHKYGVIHSLVVIDKSWEIGNKCGNRHEILSFML